MNTQIFSENLDISEAQADSENRVLRNVVLIRAGMSLNRRNYGEAVLQSAVSVFENSRAYDNHKQGSRSIRDITGFYKNVRYEDKALKADRYFTKNQAGQDAWAIATEVVSGNAPRTLAGLSINAVGTAKKHATEEGAMEIESITSAISIDDVPDAAAKGSYVEGAANDDLTAAFWEALTFDEWRTSRPDFLEKAQKHWQDIKRGDDLTAALAENETLKTQLLELETFRAAKTEQEALQSALTEAQTQTQTAQTERAAAVSERDTAQRDLAIERRLSKLSLPSPEWRASLLENLKVMPQDQWGAFIERELSKAKDAGFKSVQVTGAGQQVHTPPKPEVRAQEGVIPMHRFNNPTELATYMKEQGYIK